MRLLTSSSALAGRAPVILIALFLSAITVGAEEWNFRTQIVPVLTKAGCNAGACHGAASGQGGFRLSLLGDDAEHDYWTITRELAGRRVDLDAPAESLVLRKPSRQLEHEGGRKLARGSEGYETVLSWIQAGASFGSPELRVTAIEVTPGDVLLSQPGESAEFQVTASFSDGQKRNVTPLALFNSNDDAIAEVDRSGKATTRGRGLTSIMVRFGGQVAAACIAVPFESAGEPRILATRNFIDEEIGAELSRLRLSAAEPSTDAEFLRRVYLDLAGVLPTSTKTREWLAAKRSNEDRDKLIDELLHSEAFVDLWTLRFADLLLISGKRGAEQATLAYHNWLRAQIATNAPWNQIARALINGRGDVTQDGSANFLTLAADPRDLAEYASDIMLGTQIACARCHGHPTDRWSRDDYYAFSAFFAQVSRDGTEVGRNPRAEIEHPKTKKAVKPKLLGSCEADSMDALANWMTGPENPFFARAMVNRVWKHLLGRGLVEPVNDLRPTNPASHPRLLDRLAGEFATNRFDLRWLIRTIVSSRTYQASSRATHSDDRFYSRAALKPLSAQVMVDAIAEITGVRSEGPRAIQLVGTPPSYALDVLGRCSRERACEPAGSGGGLAQALHLINGETINDKLRPAIVGLSQKSSGEIIEELYLRALTRLPTMAERKFWEETLAKIPDRAEGLEDFIWTLLNSREFAYNH